MEITLQSLLDEIARDGGDLPALLRRYTAEGNLTAEQVTALLGEARTAFNDLRPVVASEAEIGQLETIADAITALDGETTHLNDLAAQTAVRVAEIAARAGVEGDPESTDGEGAADADDSSVVDIANADVVDLTDSAADGESTDGTGSVDSGAAVAEPVAASAGPAAPRARHRVALASIARRTNHPAPGSEPGRLPLGGALVASAEANGVRAGHMFQSWTEVGQLAANQITSTSRSSLTASAREAGRAGREYYERSGLLQLRREFPADLIILDDQADSRAILDHAADINRVYAGGAEEALVAATGWCAPSETLYDLCELPCSLAGILSFPEVGAPRGGLRWTDGIDFCDIYAAAGYFHYTEAELMADPAPVKPCMEIPCVDFNECRLEVDGMCIVGDIPQARAYPEVVAQFMQGATCARAHRTNALKIGRVLAGSQNDGVVTVAGYGATANVLSAIELKITEYRYRGLRDPNVLLEMVLPFWIRGVIRADYANRNAVDDPYDVTDAQIEAWFRSRGVIPRWVYDWQSLPAVCAQPPAAPVTAWPTQVEFIIYEAGTWVVATQDVITLENLYDSTLIRQNKFTALFVEDAFCVMKRCNPSIRFQVPICPSGNSGAQVEVTCGAPVPLPLAPAPVDLIADELSRQVTGAPLPDGSTVVTVDGSTVISGDSAPAGDLQLRD